MTMTMSPGVAAPREGDGDLDSQHYSTGLFVPAGHTET